MVCCFAAWFGAKGCTTIQNSITWPKARHACDGKSSNKVQSKVLTVGGRFTSTQRRKEGRKEYKALVTVEFLACLHYIGRSQCPPFLRLLLLQVHLVRKARRHLTNANRRNRICSHRFHDLSRNGQFDNSRSFANCCTTLEELDKNVPATFHRFTEIWTSPKSSIVM